MEIKRHTTNLKDFMFLGTNVNLKVFDPDTKTSARSVPVCSGDVVTYDPYGKFVCGINIGGLPLTDMNPYKGNNVMSYTEVKIIYRKLQEFQDLLYYLCVLCPDVAVKDIYNFINKCETYYFNDGDFMYRWTYFLTCDYEFDGGCPVLTGGKYQLSLQNPEYRTWKPGTSFLSTIHSLILSQTNDYPFNTDGKVIWITVSSPGSGYSTPPSVSVPGATAVAGIDSSGMVNGIDVINGGSGFTTPPTVTVSGNASAAAVIVVAGSFKKIPFPDRQWVLEYVDSTDKISKIISYYTEKLFKIVQNPYDSRDWRGQVQSVVSGIVNNAAQSYFTDNFKCAPLPLSEYTYSDYSFTDNPPHMKYPLLMVYNEAYVGGLSPCMKEWERGKTYYKNDRVIYEGNAYMLATNEWSGFFYQKENFIYFDVGHVGDNGYIDYLETYDCVTGAATNGEVSGRTEFTNWKRSVISSGIDTFKQTGKIDGHLSQVRPYRVEGGVANFFDLEPIYCPGKAVGVTYMDGMCFASWIESIEPPVSEQTINGFKPGGRLNQKNIIVTDGGSGYYITPQVMVSGDGKGASASAVVTDGKVTAITLMSEGTGYTMASIRILGVGSGATANYENGHDMVTYTYWLNAQVAGNNPSSCSAVGGTGIHFVETYHRRQLQDTGGSGYTSPPSVTITDRNGVGASATAVVSNGKVVSVNVGSEGKGYTQEPLISISDSPSGVPAFGRALVSNGKIKRIETSIYEYDYQGTADAEYFAGNYYSPLPLEQRSTYTNSGGRFTHGNPDTLDYIPMMHYEFMDAIAMRPKVENNIFIDRGKSDAMEYHISLSEVGSFQELLRFRNGGLYVLKKSN